MRTGFSIVRFEEIYLSNLTRKGKPSFFKLERLRVPALLLAFGFLAVAPLAAAPLSSYSIYANGKMPGLDTNIGPERQALWEELAPARPEADTIFKHRKGFILGFGLGAGLVKTKFDVGASLDSEWALRTDFIIGAALNDQWMLYWSAKVNWFGSDVFTGETSTLIFGQGGAGVTYFFNPQPISPFVSAGLGYSSYGAPFDVDVNTQYGFGFFLEGGYEFPEHFLVKGNLMWGNAEFPGFFEGGIPGKTLSLGVGVNYLLY